MTTARDLTVRLADLLSREHHAMADFLLALADFDRRRLWLDLGHASLFYFLHRELGLSKGASHYRKVGAELVQRFPEVVESLRDGRLCITSIVHLAKVLTPENRAEVLPRFFHRSRREAMEVAAAIRPAEAAPHRDVVTQVRTAGRPVLPARVATPAAPPVRQDPAVQPAELNLTAATAPTVSTAPGLPNSPERDSVEPLTADLSRFHMTVSRRFLQKLEAARDVKRAVWARDGGCCQWPLHSGGVCGSTLRLQFDHVTPRALGGPSTVENVRLLCALHNQLAARRVFGDACMDRFTRKRQQEAVEEPVGHESG